jgi:hypothetical protein
MGREAAPLIGMSYKVKEIFYTLQGEGANTGRPAVFCRFAGCNLWSGREEDRASAVCQFCDTDFLGIDGSGGGSFATAECLADAIEEPDLWLPRALVAPRLLEAGLDLERLVGHHAPSRKLIGHKSIALRHTAEECDNVFGELDFLMFLQDKGYKFEYRHS